MKRKLVLDNSVVVKWFHRVNEERVEEAAEILKRLRAEELEIWEPDLLWCELANSLLLGKGAPVRDVDATFKICARLNIGWQEVGSELVKTAARIAGEWQIAVYDAVYVALAKEVGGVLVSDDRKHHGMIRDGSVVMLAEWGKT